MITKSLLVPALVLIAFAPVSINAQNVEVTVTGIRSDKGQIAVGIFRDNETFQREEAFLEKQFKKEKVTDGTMVIRFSLEPGIYGISILDDENSDQKMEYNFLHIPKEGFGFSDYYHTGLKMPKFDSFKFIIEPGKTKRIKVRIRYL
jgi:uncharacterized protein (DUF2141 family)